MIQKVQTDYAKARLFKGKALLVFGPRQVGKTTFVQNLIADLNKKTLFLNGDESDVIVLFENPNVTKLKNILVTTKFWLLTKRNALQTLALC